MTLIILFWFMIIVAEAYRHYYLIELLHRSPNRVLSAILRTIACGGILLIAFLKAPLLGITADQWWAIPIMEVLTFWFVFDTLLNVFRGKYFYYLGNGKWIDRIQKNTVGEFPAWFFKLILALAGVTLCYYGLNAVVAYEY